jgi:hypothetical protein
MPNHYYPQVQPEINASYAKYTYVAISAQVRHDDHERVRDTAFPLIAKIVDLFERPPGVNVQEPETPLQSKVGLATLPSATVAGASTLRPAWNQRIVPNKYDVESQINH